MNEIIFVFLLYIAADEDLKHLTEDTNVSEEAKIKEQIKCILK